MPAKNLQRIRDVGACFHIYNHGVENRDIFSNDQDYQTFINFLAEYLSLPKEPGSVKTVFQVHGHSFSGVPHLPKNYFGSIELIGYSLMPDHFDLIVRQLSEGSLEKFIRSLCTRYSIYFNKKYHRTGSLFQGPYKSVHVEPGPALSELTVKLYSQGQHSSSSEYLGKTATEWVHPLKEAVPPNLERIDLSRAEPLPQVPRQRSILPDFIAISIAIFALLLTLGFGNIQLANFKHPKLLLHSSKVMAVSKPSVTPSPAPIIHVKIHTGHKFQTVNIRQEPASNSAKISQAKEGQTFEQIASSEAWVNINLASGSAGFVSANYVEVEDNP